MDAFDHGFVPSWVGGASLVRPHSGPWTVLAVRIPYPPGRAPRLAFLRAILDGTLPAAPISSALGFDLISVEEGAARFRGVPEEYHYNPMGTVHGGYVCTLLDSAMGSAVMTTLDESTAYTTTDLSIHLTRAITARTGPIIAEGRVVHRGRRMATAEGRLLDAQGSLLAHGTTTCMILPRS